MEMKKYQKIIFRDSRAEIVEEQLPELEHDQILIQTQCSLISPGTERAALTRLWNDSEFRANPGYALAGNVIEIGKQVENFQVGDRAITLKNHSSLSITSIEPWVTLKIPDSVSYEVSTFLPLASVALHAIRRVDLKLGETFAIIGSGIIGLISIQLAKMVGVKKVIVLDLVDERLELARQFGANLTINPEKDDVVEKLFAATNNEGAHAILEATGNTNVIPMAMKLTALGGRIVCVGVMEEKALIALHKEFIQRELSLIAAFQPFCPIGENIYWRWTQQANRRLLLEMMESGKLRVDEMITHRFHANKAPEAYEKIKAGDKNMLGVILDWCK
jgi:2-desacetyl-2-hydroxyethyl bacteriochlorophyllide A dehydrogenase